MDMSGLVLGLLTMLLFCVVVGAVTCIGVIFCPASVVMCVGRVSDKSDNRSLVLEPWRP